MSASLVLSNCRPYDAPAGAPPVTVVVRGGSIVSVGADADGPDTEARRASPSGDASHIDAGGLTLTPGFIDAHIHGAGGADVLHGTREAMATMSQALARAGTTAFVAASAARTERGHAHVRAVAECVGSALGGAALLGLYLEGPFVNLEKRGGLPPAGIYPATPDALDEILDVAGAGLRIMTVAPELEGSRRVIERLIARGVIPSFGHSDATYAEARAGFDVGLRHVTHLFNAMRSIHHRAPGPVLAVFETPVTAELICDGAHVDPVVVRWAYRNLGADRCVCISDGMLTLGLPDGPFEYAGRAGESRDGTARYLDGTIIGTTIPVAQMAGRFARYTGASLREAVDAATIQPARLLGLDHRKGSLDVGKDADLVLLDERWSVALTVVEGRVVYDRDGRAARA